MKIDILSVKIDSLSFSEAMIIVNSLVRQKKHSQIVTVNPEFVMMARRDEEFRKIINQADLAVADGVGLLWAAKRKGTPFRERITGVDLTWAICRLAAEKGYKVFFLGAKEGVARKASIRVKQRYPEIKIAGTYVGGPDDPATLYLVKRSKPDILFVAFGAPKQDKFIYHLKKMTNIPLAIGVGGTFDYIAGTASYAPKWMRKIGLEWLWRMITQPSRINRIITATIRFPIAVILNK